MTDRLQSQSIGMWAGRLVFSEMIQSLSAPLGLWQLGKVLQKRSKQAKTAVFDEMTNLGVPHSPYATFDGFGKHKAVQSYVSNQHPKCCSGLCDNF